MKLKIKGNKVQCPNCGKWVKFTPGAESFMCDGCWKVYSIFGYKS